MVLAAATPPQSEGNSGATLFAFIISLDVAPIVMQTVQWHVNGTGGPSTSPANASDFLGGVLPAGTVSFAAGETTKNIVVNVAGDAAVEPNEGFQVTLANPSPGLVLGAASATATILNDDQLAGIVTLVSTGANGQGNGAAFLSSFRRMAARSLSIAKSATWLPATPTGSVTSSSKT
ncbi:Calx-beta domain-containing protein [Dankookia sp. GCM10030260]|uniref:Calx-beta domain-containing protein n=1 Tax=Dankookia sp. GCM10030260 TaxID=3273390 RepID=UPI00360F01E5